MENSKFGKLIKNDFVKGFVIAVLTAVLTVIYDFLISGGDLFLINLKLVLTTSVTAAMAYLLKNLSTNSKGEILKKE
jgi:hypothetical protein